VKTILYSQVIKWGIFSGKHPRIQILLKDESINGGKLELKLKEPQLISDALAECMELYVARRRSVRASRNAKGDATSHMPDPVLASSKEEEEEEEDHEEEEDQEDQEEDQEGEEIEGGRAASDGGEPEAEEEGQADDSEDGSSHTL
jgi:hypothetical protein